MKYLLSIFLLLFFSCKTSSTKEKEDEIYSRHLQRHIPLTIISTTIPDKKEQMNLLLFCNKSLLKEISAKKIIDSLYKAKLIQPTMLVAFEGVEKDYGLNELEIPEANQYRKYNAFIVGELLPFVKKKAAIRKFNTVAIAGFLGASINAFDVSYNNDEKIQMVGMFSPNLYSSDTNDSTALLSTIAGFRKRPNIKIWIENAGLDSSAYEFKAIMDGKKSILECTLITPEKSEGILSKSPSIKNFANFLQWAFPK